MLGDGMCAGAKVFESCFGTLCVCGGGEGWYSSVDRIIKARFKTHIKS